MQTPIGLNRLAFLFSTWARACSVITPPGTPHPPIGDDMTDEPLTTADGKTYNVVSYQETTTGYWRAEASFNGRVVETCDETTELRARVGILKRLERRNGAR